MRYFAIAVFVVACAHTSYGAKLHLVTNHTLVGGAVTGMAMEMDLASDNEELSVQFTAPYFGGTTSTNRVHLFLADANHRITELEFTPSECTLRLYWAPYNIVRKIDTNSGLFDASTLVNEASNLWTGTAKVQLKVLPPRITLINAASVHPVSSDDLKLQYDTLYSITNGGISLPDLMVLPRYMEISPRFLFDSDKGYSEEWRPTTN